MYPPRFVVTTLVVVGAAERLKSLPRTLAVPAPRCTIGSQKKIWGLPLRTRGFSRFLLLTRATG